MAARVKRINLRRLTYGAACAFFKSVEEEMKTKGEAVLHLETVAPDFYRSIQVLASILNREIGYVNTQPIAECDKRRAAYIGIINTTAYINRRNPIREKREAAWLLSARLSSFTGITQHEYARLSSEIRSLLRIFGEKEVAGALAVLNLQPEAEGLREAEEAFQKAWNLRLGEGVARYGQKMLKSREVFSDVYDRYRHIVQRVEAYMITDPSEELEDFIDSINAQLHFYSLIISKQGRGAEGEAKKASEEAEAEE